MPRNTKPEPSNDINSIKFGLKEIITIITFIVSLMIGYFGIVKDIETRLVRIETRFEELNKKIYLSNEDSDLKSESPIESVITESKPKRTKQNLLSKKEEKIKDKKIQKESSERIMSDPSMRKEEE